MLQIEMKLHKIKDISDKLVQLGFLIASQYKEGIHMDYHTDFLLSAGGQS